MTAQTYATLKKSTAIAFTQQQGIDLTTYSATFEVQFDEGISYAETRIYSEFPWLAARQTNTLYVTTAGSRTIDLSGSGLMVPEQFNLIIPAATSDPAAGTRVPYAWASIDWIDSFWPTEASVVAPSLSYQGGRYWTLLDNQTAVYAPTAGAAYRLELRGLFQPAPLASVGTTTTYLSTYYPELLQAGICIFLAGGLTRNFGAQADETGQAMSWESQFVKLLAAARGEEVRRRGLQPDIPGG